MHAAAADKAGLRPKASGAHACSLAACMGRSNLRLERAEGARLRHGLNARIPRVRAGRARRRHVGARGLEVSLGGFLQDQFVVPNCQMPTTPTAHRRWLADGDNGVLRGANQGSASHEDDRIRTDRPDGRSTANQSKQLW